ncbi:hypothetical protein [Ottowia thiooxydans]|uniref:hypothetical protein n=1 Tax=Ottowia thiooxydans TaxID=219182 RepID=UPI0004091739|nr:hypothetical protein [Ottowia thiooxydans]
MAQTKSLAARRLLAIGSPRRYREGGMVRGPGNATSDSIPARLSDGEFVLPADTVRKVGAESLHDLVRMTHKPSGKPAHPARFADGGQVDENGLPNNSFGDAAAVAANPAVMEVNTPPPPIAPTPTSPGQTPASLATPTQPPTSSSWDAADTAKAATLGAGSAAYGASKYLGPVANGLGYSGAAQMAGDMAKTAVKDVASAKLPGAPTGALAKLGALGALASTAVDTYSTPTEDYRKRFGLETKDPSLLGDVAVRALGAASDLGNGMTLGLASKLFRDKTEPVAPGPASVATKPQTALPPSASGDATMPAKDPSLRPLTLGGTTEPKATPTPRPQSNVTKTVGPDGRVTYSGTDVSGDINVNGKAPRGRLSDLGNQGVNSADRIDQINRTSAINSDIAGLRQQIQQGGDAKTGLLPGGGGAVLGGGGGLRDENYLAERNALVSVGSLQAAKERAGDTWRKRGGQPGVARADTQLANFNRNREQTNSLANNVAVQHTRNAGDAVRTRLQEQGANQRNAVLASVDQRRVGIEARRQADTEATSTLERTKLGFQNQSAQQLLGAQKGVDNAKTPAEQRSSRERLLALMGKTDNDAWTYAPGGQVPDPKTGLLVTQPGVIFNRYTGETRNSPGQASSAPAAPPEGSTIRGKDGSLYVVRNGRPMPLGR